MSATAWLSASMWSCACLRKSAVLRCAYWMCRPMARSGQSSCSTKPAVAAEAVEPVLDVGGVARLAHLAVIDDVDAGLDLLLDDRRDRVADARFERRRVDRDAFLLGEHRPDQRLGPGQAAGMCGQEPPGAALHGRPSP